MKQSTEKICKDYLKTRKNSSMMTGRLVIWNWKRKTKRQKGRNSKISTEHLKK